MKSTVLKFFLAGIAGALCFVATAGDQKAINLARSHVEAVDFTNKTFRVALNGTNMNVRFTSGTRFFLNGKPAISKDLEVADHVSGTVREAEDLQREAIRIYIEKLAPK